MPRSVSQIFWAQQIAQLGLDETLLMVAGGGPLVEVRLAAYLLEQGANVEPDGGRPSPLWYACRRGNLQLAHLLLEHGANVDAHEGLPLLEAVQQGHLEIAKLMLHTYHADVNKGSAIRRYIVSLAMQAPENSIPLLRMIWPRPKWMRNSRRTELKRSECCSSMVQTSTQISVCRSQQQ
ncbi:hypothetical protein DFJ77DRAFT_460509 [Powellomyces hirtus]|nr:hypothetical protein DFJ77DRAFT_460509 [Powellomyces hirtus]